MTEHRARIAASILDADLSNLAWAVQRAVEAGTDRIHLDVMDGHFVPNITFGAGTIKRLRHLTKIPFDAHLMISEPGRYVEQFIDAGCDSITFHVEVNEPIEPTLRAIRQAGRAAGLSVKPATPLTALEPYRDLLDVVLVMTVEPGFGGQSFMRDAARKIRGARSLFGERPAGGQVHVDGGVNRETAEYCGGMGVDVLVVGSALWKKGHDTAREIRLIRALADEGHAFTLTHGEPPRGHDRWVTFASLPGTIGRRLAREIERAGIPVVELRDGGAGGPDGVRDHELLVPASAERAALERFGTARDRAKAEAEVRRAAASSPADSDAASPVPDAASEPPTAVPGAGSPAGDGE